MNKKSIWTNKDGLYVGFGTRAVESNSAAVVTSIDGQARTAILKIVGTGLQSSPTGKELANTVFIPANSNIREVRVVVDSAFTGGTSVSLAGYNASTDVVDSATGFMNAVLTATLAAGYDASYTAPGAGAGGGYIGTKIANTVKIVPTASGTFTGGVATVTIVYETPAN